MLMARCVLALLLCSGATVFFGMMALKFYGESVSTPTSRPGASISRYETLGIAAQIFVLSLPRRTDRRQHMETLRRALGLRWTYVDAIDASDDKVNRIMDQVRRQRTSPPTTFCWPAGIDSLAASSKFLDLSGSDIWATSGTGHSQWADSGPALLCATGNDSVLPYTLGLPEYKILSAAKIACWYSHWSIINRIANDQSKPDVTIILEDDVDMEWDIRERLVFIWNLLPATWDIVFLGHCWSNESQNAALQPNLVNNANATSGEFMSQMHPSSAPKCTHAYALSPSGARRLWLHLRYPSFAYSRALDQAYAWLIAEGRLSGYSVVPSVVVQQKSRGSDVMSGNGSDWRESLEKAVLGS